MKSSIAKLNEIAKKNKRLIIGLMSGTSLDGLDIALCEFEGSGINTKVQVQEFLTYPYSSSFQNKIREIFSKKSVELEKVCLMNAYIGKTHTQFINETLVKWNIKAEKIDLIASHGQTIYHAPASFHKIKEMPNSTFQIGDGDHIARGTGIITLSDFRQKHIAAGGEGAPLAMYGDYLIFSKAGESRILLNIGGISNFTFLSGSLEPEKVFSTDVGPGNTLMDAFVRENFKGKLFDADSSIAKSGKVNEKLLAAMLNHPFFDLPLPKTTGPELFNLSYLKQAQKLSNTITLSPEDVLATLNQFSAKAIYRSFEKLQLEEVKIRVYASGGGIHNLLLMENLQKLMPEVEIKNTADLGINANSKEAVLFAVLANECIAGNAISLGNMPALSMGKISLPD